MFAKLYGTQKYQVLVMLESDDEGCPCVRFSTKPEGLGICSFHISFKDTDEGLDAAEQFFNEISEKKAREIISSALSEWVPIIQNHKTEGSDHHD